jgi:hypothetical protein
MIATYTSDGRIMVEGNLAGQLEGTPPNWRASAEQKLDEMGFRAVGAWALDMDGNSVIQIEVVGTSLPPTQHPEPRDF